MSSQRGNVKKTGAQKHQNKSAWKNVYHDTSKQTQTLVSTEVAGVCRRCKEVIDWRIKYKKYKPLSQAKTCVTCKQKKVKNAYHVYCHDCCSKSDKCAKCGEKKQVVMEQSLSPAQKAAVDSHLQFELQQLPERKRRTFLRLQGQGKLTAEQLQGGSIFDDINDDDLDDFLLNDTEDGDKNGDSEKLSTYDKVPYKTCDIGAGGDSGEDGQTTGGKVTHSDMQKLDNLNQLTLKSDNCS